MNYEYITIIGIIIPFLGTILGSSAVFLCKNKVNFGFQKVFLGFAAGVMIAASIWSLIIPSIEMSKNLGKLSWIPSVIGIILGVIFLFVMDYIMTKIALNGYKEKSNFIDKKEYLEKNKVVKKSQKNKLLNLAIVLHNIPEGMAIGVVFASAINMGSEIAFLSAFSIAIGIAIQNIPEGMAISLPFRTDGISRLKSFIYGSLSGIVEPIACILTIMMSKVIGNFLPVLLGFAAGSMLYVVIKELIPESQEGKYSNIGLFSVIFGFIIMMVLDITLG